MTAQSAETVEAIASYARRTGDAVRLVLHLPNAAGAAVGSAEVRLTRRNRSVKAAATVSPATPGALVRVDVPAVDLPAGTWAVAVRLGPDTGFRRVQARLLANRTQPVALLPGRPPRTTIKPPAGRPTSRPRRARMRRLVSRSLGVLPDNRAARIRAALRRIGGRWIG